MKVALISGITGQDGSYLAEFLIKKKYIVHGIVRRSSSFNTGRIDHLYNDKSIINTKLFLHYGDLTDSSNLNSLVKTIEPDEIYNLGAQSHVAVSFEVPEYTANVDAIGTLRFLDAIRSSGLNTKFYQASTSELYGLIEDKIQNENTPFHPRSPYAIAKLYAFWIVKNYREAYNLFATNGILFNHESERRGKTFVTRKITIAVSKIMLGLQKTLVLGNLDAKRDWGYAPDYVEGMWQILQADEPEDFVIATGRMETVRKFCELTANALGWNKGTNSSGIIWENEGLKEIGRRFDTKEVVIRIDKRYYRPTEVEELLGDSTKAEKKLGWKPKITLEQLISEMVYEEKKILNLL